MSTLDEMMGFDPADLSIFNEQPTSTNDPRIYKTSLALTKSEDGSYRSKIRILFNPHSLKESVVHLETYYIRDADGGLTVPSSLSVGDKNCPIFKGFKKVRYAGEEGSAEREAGLARAKKLFQKNSSNWVLIQVVEDENQPEVVGQFKFWKLPVTVFNKLNAKMKPVDPKKMADPLMDYLFGKVLEVEVTPGPEDPKDPTRKNREMKYDLSEFDSEVTPIMNTDSTPLFTDEEMATIEAYVAEKKKISKKAADKRPEEIKKLNAGELGAAVRVLYAKAIEFMNATAPDVRDMGYKPWDEATVTRVEAWLNSVIAGNDPGQKVNAGAVAAAESLPDMFEEMTDDQPDGDEDDIPF